MTNFTNYTTKCLDIEYPGISFPWRLTLVTMAACLTIVGCLGNLMLLLVMWKRRKVRGFHNTFIANLAMADFLVIVSTIPYYLYDLTTERCLFVSKVHCSISSFITWVSYLVSAVSLVLISFNRYVKVCHRPLFRKLFSAKRNLVICVAVWCISLALNSPLLIVGLVEAQIPWLTSYGYDPGSHICNARGSGKDPCFGSIFMLLVLTVTPFLIGCFNAGIFRRWRGSRTKLRKTRGLRKRSARGGRRGRSAMKPTWRSLVTKSMARFHHDDNSDVRGGTEIESVGDWRSGGVGMSSSEYTSEVTTTASCVVITDATEEETKPRGLAGNGSSNSVKEARRMSSRSTGYLLTVPEVLYPPTRNDVLRPSDKDSSAAASNTTTTSGNTTTVNATTTNINTAATATRATPVSRNVVSASVSKLKSITLPNIRATANVSSSAAATRDTETQGSDDTKSTTSANTRNDARVDTKESTPRPFPSRDEKTRSSSKRKKGVSADTRMKQILETASDHSESSESLDSNRRPASSYVARNRVDTDQDTAKPITRKGRVIKGTMTLCRADVAAFAPKRNRSIRSAFGRDRKGTGRSRKGTNEDGAVLMRRHRSKEDGEACERKIPSWSDFDVETLTREAAKPSTISDVRESDVDRANERGAAAKGGGGERIYENQQFGDLSASSLDNTLTQDSDVDSNTLNNSTAMEIDEDTCTDVESSFRKGHLDEGGARAPQASTLDMGHRRKKQKHSIGGGINFTLLRSLLVITLCVFALYTPFAVTIILTFIFKDDVPPELPTTATLLLFSNCCLNWAVYGMMNTAFRHAFSHAVKDMLTCRSRWCCCCCRGRVRRERSESAVSMSVMAGTRDSNDLLGDV